MRHRPRRRGFVPRRRLSAVALAGALALMILGSAASAAAATIPYAPPDLWTYANPYPSEHSFVSLSMPTAYDAWAVTEYGEILASDDGGIHWWPQRSLGNERFKRVVFLNVNRGWVVGDGGVMKRTTNGGLTWLTCATGVTTDLRDVHFTSPTHGWAVGASSTLLRSTDGGATWTPKASPAVGHLMTVTFTDADHGWLADTGSGPDKGSVSRTTDGGRHWMRVEVSPAGFTPFDLDFVSARRGWVAGHVSSSAKVYRTTDGGATWAATTGLGADYATTVDFSDALHGWVSQDPGSPARSTDGGVTWQTAPVGGAFEAIAMRDGVHGCLAGPYIYSTTDGGTTWSRRDRDVTSKSLLDISFDQAAHGWAVGADGTMLQWHGEVGAWVEESSGVDYTLDDVAAAGSGRGSAAGVDWDSGDPNGTGKIIGTTDWGGTWGGRIGLSNTQLNATEARTALIGIAGGSGGTLLETLDGGIQWNTLATSGLPFGANVKDLEFVSILRGWAVVTESVYKTTDGGASWTHQDTPWDARDLSFYDSLHGWGCGSAGGLIATTDGGETWAKQTADTTETLFGVTAAGTTRAWAVTVSGAIFRTVDGGAHWTRQTSRTTQDLYAVETVDGAQWAVGAGGTILTRGYRPAPHLVRVAPTAVRVGRYVTVYGWGFGSSRGDGYVKIGGKQATRYVFWRDMRIKVRVPKVTTGMKLVFVRTASGDASNTRQLRVRR